MYSPVVKSHLQESLDDATDPWGIKVERVEIKDVKLPQQLQRAMAAEAEASREARAKVTTGSSSTFYLHLLIAHKSIMFFFFCLRL